MVKKGTSVQKLIYSGKKVEGLKVKTGEVGLGREEFDILFIFNKQLQSLTLGFGRMRESKDKLTD